MLAIVLFTACRRHRAIVVFLAVQAKNKGTRAAEGAGESATDPALATHREADAHPMRAAATAEATDMDTRWDGLLVNARLVTLAGDAGYGVIEDGALGWHDGMLVFAGHRTDLLKRPASLGR